MRAPLLFLESEACSSPFRPSSEPANRKKALHLAAVRDLRRVVARLVKAAQMLDWRKVRNSTPAIKMKLDPGSHERSG